MNEEYIVCNQFNFVECDVNSIYWFLMSEQNYETLNEENNDNTNSSN